MTMPIDTAGGDTGRRRVPALIAVVALVAAACGGSSATAVPTVGSSAGGPSALPSSVSGTPTVAPSDAGYTGPEATITYSIWGDPTEIKNQQAIVDAFHAANPKITVKVTVSDWDTYWDKLQTGIAGGDASRRVRDGRPALPGLPARDVLLDLKPFIDRDGYDLSQLADQAVADFTTPDGQFGLPRDLNVIALYYNKKMFDAAGIPYPDDTWDWAKLDSRPSSSPSRAPTARSASGASTPRPPTWRTTGRRWSGRTAATSSRPTTRPAWSGHQAAAGIQFLQDLIWKDKVMPDPAAWPADSGDAFEQGQAAMEANGSWLVATHLAAGIDFGIAPLPKGPAGQATSINPTGAVVYKGTKNPDAAWAFVKYLASPAAQTKIMELKASLPVNKEVLAGSFATSFDGAKVLADAIAYAHLKPSFKGYNDWTTALQNELDANVFTDPNEDRQAGADRRPPAARRDPRRPVRSTRPVPTPR